MTVAKSTAQSLPVLFAQHIAYKQQRKITGSPKTIATIEIPEIEAVTVKITEKEDSTIGSSEEEEGQERIPKISTYEGFLEDLLYQCYVT